MDKLDSFELELDDFCEGCGYFEPDVTKVNVSSMGDILNRDIKYRTYIKCTKCEVCRHIANKMRVSENENNNLSDRMCEYKQEPIEK